MKELGGITAAVAGAGGRSEFGEIYRLIPFLQRFCRRAICS